MGPIEKQLRSAGVKTTAPRVAVLQAMQGSGQLHLTAEDIYRLLQDRGLAIGIATIYRVLTHLEATGLVRRNQFAQGKAYFELADGDKAHFHMVNAPDGQIIEFSDPELLRRIEEIAAERGYRVTDLQVIAHVQPLHD